MTHLWTRFAQARAVAMESKRAYDKLIVDAVPERIEYYDGVSFPVWSQEVRDQFRWFNEVRSAWERVLYVVTMDSTDEEIQEVLRAFWSVVEEPAR